MKTLIVKQATRDRIAVAWVQRWMSGLSKALIKGTGRKEIVVVFVTTSEMKRLNKQYRGKDYATDILSFEAADPATLGELVLCLPVIRAQAKRTGLKERGELGYMLVHGVLHLLGYDHVARKDEAEMFALQDKIYARLERSVGFR